jgi:hypothetical protein
VQKEIQEDTDDGDDGDSSFNKKRKRKGVRWAIEDAAAQEKRSLARLINPFALVQRLPRWAIWLAALLFFRSRFFRIRARAVITFIKLRARRRFEAVRSARLKGG